jgi:hypothetical protein
MTTGTPTATASTFLVNNHSFNNHNSSHTSHTSPPPVIAENPNALLTPPDSIHLSNTKSYYIEVAEPLKSVYGMICLSECASLNDYKSLSKEAQLLIRAYVPPDLAIAKFKVDSYFSQRDEHGRTEQKVSNASANLQHHSLLSVNDVTEKFVIQFHDFTERTLQEQVKSVINQMVRYRFNEILTKCIPIFQHDGVRLLSYNDVLAYVGHRLMPPALSGQITKVWKNVYKRGEQRRVLTQSIVDLFHLRFHSPDATRTARGHILDHNFICYYINEVINNLKAPMLKKNKSDDLRSVSVSTKRKNTFNADHPSAKSGRSDLQHINHLQNLSHPTSVQHIPVPAPNVTAPFATVPGALQAAPFATTFQGMVPAQVINPTPQPMMDPQQMLNFMSMFVPQFQQTFASMNHQTPANSSLTSGMAATDSFSQYIDRRLHQSLPCHGSKGNVIDRNALLNEELPDDNNGMLSLSDEDDDDVDSVVPHPNFVRARTSKSSPYQLHPSAVGNNASTGGSYTPFGGGDSSSGTLPPATSTTPTTGLGIYSKQLSGTRAEPTSEEVINNPVQELDVGTVGMDPPSSPVVVVQQTEPQLEDGAAAKPMPEGDDVARDGGKLTPVGMEASELDLRSDGESKGTGDELPKKVSAEQSPNKKVTDQSPVDLKDLSDTETSCEVECVLLSESFRLWAGAFGCSPHESSFLRLVHVESMTSRGINVAGSSGEYNCCNPKCGKQFRPTYCCVKSPSKPHIVMFCGDCVETAQRRLCMNHCDVSPTNIYGDPKKYMSVYTEGNHMFGNSKWGRGKTCNGCKTTDYKRACKTSSNALFYCKQCRDDYIQWQQTSDADDLNAPYVCLFCVDCKEHAVLRNVQLAAKSAISNPIQGSVTRRRGQRKLPTNSKK